MANPYDPEDKDKDLNSLPRDELDKLEHKYSTSEDEAEDKKIEDGEDPDALPRQGMGRKLREHGQAAEAEETAALDEKIKKEWAKATAEDEAAGNSLYMPTKKGEKVSFWGKLNKRRKWLIGAAAAGGLTIALVALLLSFLNISKFDFLVSNIDNRVFARFTSVADRRSSKWVQAYVSVRLLEWGDQRGEGAMRNNQLFRSNAVDTNHPFTDWYRTMRTSNFEQELLEKNGIKFVSVADANGQVRPGYINLNGERAIDIPILNADFEAIGRGDIAAFDRFGQYLDFDTFDNDRQARRAIKRVVNDNTRFYQVVERRMYRKAIQNMTGVRSWRFFEDTRNRIDARAINIRNKIITAAIPETVTAGKFLRCMMGMATCQKSVDQLHSQYRAATGEIIGVDNCDAACEDAKTRSDVPDYDPNSDPNNPQRSRVPVERPNPDCPPAPPCNLPPITVIEDAPNLELTPRELEVLNFMKGAIGKAAFTGISLINIIELLELLEGVDGALSGGLTKMVAVARGTQAMGLYQSSKTARDQVKAGNPNSEELDEYLETYDTVARSEGWTEVMRGEGDPTQLTDNAESRRYCGKENQDFIVNPDNAKAASEQFHYLCDDKQIGGGSRAASISGAYTRIFQPILGPITDAYGGLKSAEGGILGRAIAFGYSIWETVANAVANAFIAIIRFVGWGESLKKVEVAMESLVAKIAGFLGAGPILSEQEPVGVLMNWMIQGGAFTAETVSRTLGALATTTTTRSSTQAIVAQYQNSKLEDASLSERYLSTTNPESLASQGFYKASELGQSGIVAKLFDVKGVLKQITSNITSLFDRSAGAQDFDGYEGADFAGIQTYDFPEECINLNPLLTGPTNATNIFSVFNQFGIEGSLSDWGATAQEQWAVVNSTEKFYDYLYGKVADRDDPDEVTLLVYNCNLLDTSIRGGLGYLYGYKNDNGLEEPAPAAPGGPGDGGGPDACDRLAVFNDPEDGSWPYSSDTEYMDTNNPPPSGQGSNYAQNVAAPVRFPAVCLGGGDDRHDLSYTKKEGGAYFDGTGQKFSDRGLKE